MSKTLQKQRGFTLLEIVIATAVCVVALLGMLMSNAYIQQTNNAGFERLAAMQDAHQVLERMRISANTGVFPANVVAAYPDDGEVSGLGHLSSERITVHYVNTTADPIDITATVNWSENGVRPVSVELHTLMTQRS